MAGSRRLRPNLGSYREDIGIEENEETVDAFGGMPETWSNVATVQGKITPISASERTDDGRATTTVRVAIEFRFYDGLATSHRLTHNDRTFNIGEVIDVDNMGVIHRCLCEEVTQ